MARPRKSVVVAAALVTAIGLVGGALVRAQQSQPSAVAAPSGPPSATDEAPPPPASALSGAIVAPPAPPTETQNVQPDTSQPSAEESSKPPPPPMKRPRYQAAVMQALDKVTAETLRFEVPINKPIRYKNLIFVVRACETTAPDEGFNDAASYVEIDSQPIPPDGKPPPPPRQVFQGWMFANGPGVHPFEHPVYDAWLIACKTDSPGA